jgi:hypothetical protein
MRIREAGSVMELTARPGCRICVQVYIHRRQCVGPGWAAAWDDVLERQLAGALSMLKRLPDASQGIGLNSICVDRNALATFPEHDIQFAYS